MRKMRIKKIKAFCISTFLLGIFFSGTVFATELNVKTTEQYEKWNQLSTEEKEKTLMPRTFSIEVPDEMFEEANQEDVPSLLNELKGVLKSKSLSEKNKLKNIEASYTNSRYNIANKLNLRVEHQGGTTECWAFSMIKSLETNIALRSGVTEIPDFSERHMNYATSKTFLDGINENAFEREAKNGGLPLVALAYLTNGQGAVLESEMPFEDNANKIKLAEIDKEVDTVVTEYATIPSLYKEYTTDDKGNTISVTYSDGRGTVYTSQEVKIIREMIKKHIVEDGAIPSVTAGNQKKYYNTPTDIRKATNYNCNDADMVRDHGITIVGWDDNYPKENFVEGARPSTDGAYIVLNSYGTENFDEGYLYISYEDVLIESELYVIKNSEKKDYANIYQADFFGAIDLLGTDSSGEGYYANIYERDASKTEFITDVGVTIADYVELEIYVNPSSESMNKSDLIKIGETKSVLEPGYHRIDVTPTKLTGNKFAIVVKQISENGVFYFSIERPVAGTQFACVDSDNNSYYSINGEAWENLKTVQVTNSNIDMSKADVCIKAFTVEEYTDQDPDQEPEENPDQDKEQKPEQNPDQDKEQNPEENPDQNPEQNPDQDKEQNPDQDPEQNPEQNPDKDPEQNPEQEPEQNPDKDQEPDVITITSEKYVIDDKEIYKIVSDTSISEFKKNIQTEATIKILDENKEITNDNAIIKTGMKIKLNDTKEFELIVRGDIDCDGEITLTDLSKLICHYNEMKNFILKDSPYRAADMNYDKKVTLTDVSQMVVLYNSK